MLAVPTEPVETGSQLDTWPPHITLVPWFDLPTNRWQDFDASFKEEDIVWDLDSRVRVVKKELFGTDDAPIEVARLFGIMSVLAHARSAGLVREFGGEFDVTYTGSNWHAHISDSTHRVYDVGEDIALNAIAVFQKKDGVKIIKQQYTRKEVTGNQ
ncbi:MAG: hypothetical protein UY35_C0024G0009 [Candidatus Saccharibacteria bacterium GW2011_GWC2_48_9]|nr:MAG: hypothetical protein UY35_C0024G0009 [Candidatus Saccharibacteria bacterium GW2011_GWC2_48_9]